jgi:predicted transcriptional regulator
MSNVDLVTGADFPPPRGETVEEKSLRLAREAEMIAEARAAVAAGRVVSFEAVSAWIDSLGTEDELPLPQSGR